ncbi:Coiled-coil domain-containing protein 14 [Labeo rohita]|uniref:Coiled-coil domain-containing protein 14 n=1 Tax=Labeo rohita TaxID=84645 RepID=A0ABQ8LVB9_LABRO|nr:Coiled-coil domain-containing protein 14 [Labeo rohita]
MVCQSTSSTRLPHPSGSKGQSSTIRWLGTPLLCLHLIPLSLSGSSSFRLDLGPITPLWPSGSLCLPRLQDYHGSSLSQLHCESPSWLWPGIHPGSSCFLISSSLRRLHPGLCCVCQTQSPAYHHPAARSQSLRPTGLPHSSDYTLVSCRPSTTSGLHSSNWALSFHPSGSVRLLLPSGSTLVLCHSGSTTAFRITATIAAATCFTLALWAPQPPALPPSVASLESSALPLPCCLPSVGSTEGCLHGCGLGSALAPPFSSLASPSVASTLDSVLFGLSR